MSTVPQSAAGAARVATPSTISPGIGCDLDVDEAVRHFVATADGLGAPRPAADEMLAMTHQMAAFARDRFCGKLLIDTSVDPEAKDDVCILFHVEVAGTVDEIVALYDAWARRAVSVAPRWPGLFCLSIEAR